MTAASPDERAASWLELFFDLVLVAAVAALANQLHHDRSLTGLVVFAGLFVPVWWIWWGFTWYSSAFNSDDAVNRVALLVAMAGVGGVAVGVPGAAHGHSNTFALACAGLFALLALLFARAWALVPESRPLSARYATGDAIGAALWLSSLTLDESWRPAVWIVAMVVLMGAPVLAAASLPVLSYDARHIAERYGLFTLIVLGESVVATVSSLDAGMCDAAIAVALLGLALAATIWWLYFDRWRAMPAGGLLAGWVWAQGHLLVFAGIASTAVGIELMIEESADGSPTALADRLPLGAGLASYLAAMALIRGATRRADWVVWLRLTAGAAALACALVGGLGPLATTALITAIVVAEVAFELWRAPSARARDRPRLPHELRRPRA